MRQWLRLTIVLGLLSTPGLMAGCSPEQTSEQEADVIRDLERQRIRALVDGDMIIARRLHADDFQLITPDGSEFTKQTYLGQIESGQLDYRIWEPGEIQVRLYHDVAVIRYDDSRFEVAVNGELARTGALRHIDVYEKRNGQWQVVWSQGSGGQAP